MFRTKIYVATDAGMLMLYTNPVPQWKDADRQLEVLKTSLGDKMTGGTIEQHTLGIGWVIREKAA